MNFNSDTVGGVITIKTSLPVSSSSSVAFPSADLCDNFSISQFLLFCGKDNFVRSIEVTTAIKTTAFVKARSLERIRRCRRLLSEQIDTGGNWREIIFFEN